MPQLRTRRSYAANPALCNRVFELLDTWIPNSSDPLGESPVPIEFMLPPLARH